MKLNFLLSLLAVASFKGVDAQEHTDWKGISRLHQIRGGLNNCMTVCKYLVLRFPGSEFEFIPAGIPSMGTTPAAFQLERDVLSKGPIDFLFEEAAVNDASNGRSGTEQIRAMEGIVRQMRRSNPWWTWF